MILEAIILGFILSFNCVNAQSEMNSVSIKPTLPSNATPLEIRKAKSTSEKWALLFEKTPLKESLEGKEGLKKETACTLSSLFQQDIGEVILYRYLERTKTPEGEFRFTGVIKVEPKYFILEGDPLVFMDINLDGILDEGLVPEIFLRKRDRNSENTRGNYNFEKRKIPFGKEKLFNSWYEFFLTY